MALVDCATADPSISHHGRIFADSNHYSERESDEEALLHRVGVP